MPAMCCRFHLIVLSLLLVSLHAELADDSGQCIDVTGKTDSYDTSVLLQRVVAHVPADQHFHTPSGDELVQGVIHGDIVDGEVKILWGKVEEHIIAPPRTTSQEPTADFVCDLWVALLFASLVFLHLFLVHMLRDKGDTLGLPISGGRTFLLDNAKFLLVTMVVWGHTTSYLMLHLVGTEKGVMSSPNFGMSRPFVDPRVKQFIYRSFYPLHIRTLCFISGIVSRSGLKADKILMRLVVPLLGYCFVILPCNEVLETYLFGVAYTDCNPLRAVIAAGGQLQWYLVGLIWWRVLASLIERFSPFARMLVAYVVAALSLYTATTFFSLHALTFFPCFVAGQLFPYEQALSKVQWRPSTAVLGMLLLVASSNAAASCESFKNALVGGELMSNVILNPLEVPLKWLPAFAIISLEILKSIVFLLVVCPRKETFVTEAGSYSLYPYLLHGPFVLNCLGKAVVLTPWLKDRATMPVPLTALVLVFDLFICAAVNGMLASRPTRFVFGFLLEPTWIKSFYIKDGIQANASAARDSTDQKLGKHEQS